MKDAFKWIRVKSDVIRAVFYTSFGGGVYFYPPKLKISAAQAAKYTVKLCSLEFLLAAARLPSHIAQITERKRGRRSTPGQVLIINQWNPFHFYIFLS